MRLVVLNPKGRDPEQSFAEGAGTPDARGHAPINFHAFAACTQGVFHNQTDKAIAEEAPVLVLIRRKLKRTLAAVRACKAAGRTVLVSWKETGLLQVEDQLRSAASWELLRAIVSQADGCLSATEDLLPIYRAADPTTPAEFIPTPYPLQDPYWSFAQPIERCKGIFLGTRRFKHRSRCHQLALSQAALLARSTGCRVTVIHQEGRASQKHLEAIGIPKDCLQVREPLPFADYLRLMSKHRIVLQRDHSVVPGQVAGDALMCGVPCVGGSGAIDRLAFGEWCAGKVGGEKLASIAEALLTNDALWLRERERFTNRAREVLSYGVVARQLARFLARLEST